MNQVPGAANLFVQISIQGTQEVSLLLTFAPAGCPFTEHRLLLWQQAVLGETMISPMPTFHVLQAGSSPWAFNKNLCHIRTHFVSWANTNDLASIYLVLLNTLLRLGSQYLG